MYIFFDTCLEIATMHQLLWIVPKSGFLGLFSSCRSFASSWCLSLMAAGLKLSTKLVQVVRSKASQRQTSKMQLGCSAMQTDFDCSCIIWCILQLDHVLPCFTIFYHVLPRKSKRLCKSGGVIGKAEDFDEGLMIPTYSNHFSFFNVRRPHYFAHSRATFFGPGQARDIDSL